MKSKQVLAVLLMLGIIAANGDDEKKKREKRTAEEASPEKTDEGNENENKENRISEPKETTEEASPEKTDEGHENEKKENRISEPKEATLNSIGDHLNILEQRLVSIEEKIDHVLFHHSHDVTPHEVKFTPMGPQIVPNIKNPNSAHHQMKIHDFARASMNNPYAYMGNMAGMGMGMMGYPGMF